MKAGPKHATAWAELLHAVALIENAWELAKQLRFHGIAYGLPNPHRNRDYWRWRNVDALPKRRVVGVPPWVEAIQAGAHPGALTATEVIERYCRRPTP